MKWGEFTALLSGLSGDSPLGRIVQIRVENDPKIIDKFTTHQRRIWSEWRNKKAVAVTENDRDLFLEQMKNAFIAMAGGVVNG